MSVSFNDASAAFYRVGDKSVQTRSGAIANGNKFINESISNNLRNGRVRVTIGVLPKQGNSFSDLYSYIFRNNYKNGGLFSTAEKLAQNGNSTKTFLVNGVRRLKISKEAGKFAGVTLYNSKGVKLGSKLLKALF